MQLSDTHVLSQATRSDLHFAVSEQVYACMETGNAGQATILIEEYAGQYPDEADALRVAIVRDYGRGI